MAKWLQALAALLGDLDSILSTHMAANSSYNSGPRGPNALSGFHRYCSHVIYRHPCRQNAHTCKIKSSPQTFFKEDLMIYGKKFSISTHRQECVSSCVFFMMFG